MSKRIRLRSSINRSFISKEFGEVGARRSKSPLLLVWNAIVFNCRCFSGFWRSDWKTSLLTEFLRNLKSWRKAPSIWPAFRRSIPSSESLVIWAELTNKKFARPSARWPKKLWTMMWEFLLNILNLEIPLLKFETDYNLQLRHFDFVHQPFLTEIYNISCI